MTGEVFLAHGLAGRSDLPVPLWLALYAGAAAVVISFFALTALWKTPRLQGEQAGRPLPGFVERVADSTVTRAALRVFGVVAVVVVLVTAWSGGDSADNPAPAWFYAWFWVGLVAVSLLLGPVWRLVNPARTIAAAACLALPALRVTRPLPDRLGYRPAIAGMLAFLWLELVFPHSDAPLAVAVFLTAYLLAQVVGGVRYGPSWFDRGDTFEVYFGLIAALAPVGRRADGRLVRRNPLDGLLTLDRSAGLTPFILVVLGATAFDGLTRLPLWTDNTRELGPAAAMLTGTAGLALAIALIAGAYTGAVRLTRPFLRKGTEPYRAFAHSLVPIMVGYTIAHYFSFAVFEGQQGLLRTVDYTVLSPAVIAAVQIAGIVLGHVLGVVSAHDRALVVLRAHYVKAGQYPVLALMVGYTAIGIYLVSGA
ncbi:hypothetical protein [Amycolatopsis sp. YIM 10]|uniref:hypothetical protein n=1 Tax=Amycolatopsis sp. YIM 10 TaxID=2653857 RepID=UPI0012A97807|nr:hypothetical protein [Amycolatopsis sp. YIM 10]QFU91269.1 hypothetical protein YIM_30515 [Amycolatopsis sp. YIM 10]